MAPVPCREPQPPSAGELPPEAYAAAFAALGGIGSGDVASLLGAMGPREAFEAVRAGRAPGARAARDEARRLDVAALWRAHVEEGVRVLVRGRPAYPGALLQDPEVPAVLFARGSADAFDRWPTVAIVGTRAPTRYGLSVAAQLGAELAAAGVVVLATLVQGIESAAHEGAVAAWHARRRDPAAADRAPPVAVVSGDVVSPRAGDNAGLWRRVGEAGTIVSAVPIGAVGLDSRCTVRRCIVAALSDVVVVVESHASCAALRTVQAAASRGTPVGAVPGSVRSPASAGTNALLADGCVVVRDTSDVLVALSLAGAGPGPGPRPTHHL